MGIIAIIDRERKKFGNMPGNDAFYRPIVARARKPRYNDVYYRFLRQNISSGFAHVSKIDCGAARAR